MSGVHMQALAARALRVAVGFMLFQGAWFTCVAGAADGQTGIGIAAVAALVALALASSADRAADLRLLALCLVVGFAWDSALARLELVDYASPWPLPGWAPAWIVALWALFAPMLREPLRALHGRPFPAALVGGAGGAMSYAAAQRLGACAFPDPVTALVVIGIGWAWMLPLLLEAARQLARSTPAGARPAMREAGA